MANVTAFDDADPQSINKSIQISMCVLVVFLYLIGVNIHSKVISASKQDKQVTWKLDVTNSFILIFYYANNIVMNGLTILVNDLYLYTGPWFCYAYKFLSIYCNAYATGHSLIIALMKYVIIVKYVRVRKSGEENVKRIFFWTNLIYPAYIIGMFTLARPDFLIAYDGVSPANRCLGKSDIISSQNSNQSATKLHNICELAAPLNKISFEYMIYGGRTTICWLHIVIGYSNCWNVLEFFIYCAIFKFMRR